MSHDCSLYLITPPILPAEFADTLAEALDAGGVDAVQLRLKDVDDDTLRRAVDRYRPVVQSRGIAFILNDRPDLAAAHGCDGAHVGAEDSDVALARRTLDAGNTGKKYELGASCYDSRDLALRAGEAGADYVAFGAFYPSTTKDTGLRAELALLEWWSEIMVLPCVAIGGITPANCGPLVRAGANFLAVVSAVWAHPEGAAAGVRAFARAIAEA